VVGAAGAGCGEVGYGKSRRDGLPYRLREPLPAGRHGCASSSASTRSATANAALAAGTPQ
jgi:hypothetical protein